MSRELTIRIRFLGPSLGNVKVVNPRSPMNSRFVMLRSETNKAVLFMASWHRANMRAAADMLGRRQDQVDKIYWDNEVDGKPDGWEHRRVKGGRSTRFVMHEAFKTGQVIGLNCMAPDDINDDEMVRLMSMAGKYRGLSPWRPGDYGHFEVVEIRPRRRNTASDDVSSSIQQCEPVSDSRGNS